MPLACARVRREAYDRTKEPTEEGRASALRGRLQSVEAQRSSTRARPKSRLRPAPPGARRGEPAVALLPVERERARDEEKKSRHRQSGGQRMPFRLGASLLRIRGSPPFSWACASLVFTSV